MAERAAPPRKPCSSRIEQGLKEQK